jgi:hypothetical protein
MTSREQRNRVGRPDKIATAPLFLASYDCFAPTPN